MLRFTREMYLTVSNAHTHSTEDQETCKIERYTISKLHAVHRFNASIKPIAIYLYNATTPIIKILKQFSKGLKAK